MVSVLSIASARRSAPKHLSRRHCHLCCMLPVSQPGSTDRTTVPNTVANAGSANNDRAGGREKGAKMAAPQLSSVRASSVSVPGIQACPFSVYCFLTHRKRGRGWMLRRKRQRRRRRSATRRCTSARRWPATRPPWGATWTLPTHAWRLLARCSSVAAPQSAPPYFTESSHTLDAEGIGRLIHSALNTLTAGLVHVAGAMPARWRPKTAGTCAHCGAAQTQSTPRSEPNPQTATPRVQCLQQARSPQTRNHVSFKQTMGLTAMSLSHM